jgi:hypothetical protein
MKGNSRRGGKEESLERNGNLGRKRNIRLTQRIENELREPKQIYIGKGGRRGIGVGLKREQLKRHLSKT